MADAPTTFFLQPVNEILTQSARDKELNDAAQATILFTLAERRVGENVAYHQNLQNTLHALDKTNERLDAAPFQQFLQTEEQKLQEKQAHGMFFNRTNNHTEEKTDETTLSSTLSPNGK